jgi:cobalamin biosynthesis protein CobD/CbiB
MSDFERHVRRRRQRERDVHRADRAVGAFIVWVVVGVIALVLALVIFQSTALVVVVGAVAAIAILWRVLMRPQR